MEQSLNIDASLAFNHCEVTIADNAFSANSLSFLFSVLYLQVNLTKENEMVKPIMKVKECVEFNHTSIKITLLEAVVGVHEIQIVGCNCSTSYGTSVEIRLPAPCQATVTEFSGVSTIFTISCTDIADNKWIIIGCSIAGAVIVGFAIFICYTKKNYSGPSNYAQW